MSGGGQTARCWPADSTASPGVVMHRQGDGFWSPTSLALAQRPQGDVVVARAGLDQLWRWDRATGQPAGAPVSHPVLGPAGQTMPPLVTVTAAAGPLAVTDAGYRSGGLRRWDVMTGEAAGEVIGPDTGPVWALASATLPDGSAVVISGGASGLVHRWDPVTGTAYGDPTGCGRAVAITAVRLPGAGTVICVLDAKGIVHRLDLATGEPVRTGWQPPHPWLRACHGLLAAAPAGDGGVIAACVDGRTIQLWDLLSGAPARTLTLPGSPRVNALAGLRLAGGTPVIVAADGDGNVQQFDARTGQPHNEPVQPHGWSARSVCPVTDPGGRVIVALERLGQVRRFDARTGAGIGDPRWPWRPGESYGLAAAGLPDGRVILAVPGEDGIARQDAISGTVYPPGDGEGHSQLRPSPTASTGTRPSRGRAVPR